MIGNQLTTVPAWAGFGSTPDSHMYMQPFVYVNYVCEVAFVQASVSGCVMFLLCSSVGLAFSIFPLISACPTNAKKSVSCIPGSSGCIKRVRICSRTDSH